MSKPEVILFVTESPSDLKPLSEKARASGAVVYQKSVEDLDTLNEELLKEVTLMVEWLPVSRDRKESLYIRLWDWIHSDMLILTAAHERMVTHVAGWCPYPERVIGFSPFGLITGGATTTLAFTLHNGAETKTQAEQAVTLMGLDWCWIEDAPGMVLPRIYAMLANEAAFALQENVATAQDIDTAMKLGTNYPMGPLTWADTVGVDVVYAILDNLYTVYREERYRPCLLITKMVASGHLGQKTGQGFYRYRQAGQHQELTGHQL